LNYRSGAESFLSHTRRLRNANGSPVVCALALQMGAPSVDLQNVSSPAAESESTRFRISICEFESLPQPLVELLGENYEIAPGKPFECDVRLIGPQELNKEGSRGLRRHRLRSPKIPLVVLAPAEAPPELIRDCYREGVVEIVFIEELETQLPRVLSRALDRAQTGRHREDEAEHMASELGKRARDLEAALEAVKSAYDQTLVALVSALDHREKETACHSQRVAVYAVQVGLRIGLQSHDLENLYRGALLHDIGKIGIPDAVLLKPGSFTHEEWEIMQGHTRIGGEILGGIAFLESASDVPLFHHEAWCGDGYPHGLEGEDIPLHARIFAIIDSYDAIRSKRP